MVKNLAQQGVISLSDVRPQLAKGPTKTLYIWLVYVYLGLSTVFDYPCQFSPLLLRIIESLLYYQENQERHIINKNGRGERAALTSDS